MSGSTASWNATEHVSSIVDWVEELARSPWFYLIVYVVALLDSVIPLVPSETVVIIGGVAASAHDKWVWGVIIVGALGAVCGDNLAYAFGRRASVGLTRRRNRKGKKSKLDWAARQLDKRGGVLILTARFIPGGRTAVTVMSGVTHQRWPRFFLFTVIAGVLWATYAALLGYFGGQRFQDNHPAAFILAFGMALSVSFVIELGRWIWHRRHRSSEPATA
jgi:membrane protein DedA with SNARE-associated domain